MSGNTIPTGGTTVLTTSLNGNITFANQGSDSGVLLIEPTALSYGPAGTNVVQTYLGGNITNFSPGDTIVLANLEEDYANFDKAPGSLANDGKFDKAIFDIASLGGVNIYVSPGNQISTNNFLVNALYGAELQTLAAPYLASIEDALFGVNSLDATLTLTPIFDPASSHSFTDAVITTNQLITKPPCFVSGTRIATPAGETPVQHLAIGDALLTAQGATRKITWIGHRSLDFRTHPHPEQARPIRITAEALADGIPARDLLVSPDHALLLDGVLVQAKDLCDGVSITQEDRANRITYIHIQLETHDILLAEGAPAESFLDTGHRGLFANSDQPVTLHPDMMQRMRVSGSCAPLVTGGDRLAEIRTRLLDRNRQRGCTIVEATPWLRAGIMILAPAGRQSGELRFNLPPGLRQVELITGHFVPAEIDPYSTDRRRLGIAINKITLDGKPVRLKSAGEAQQRHSTGALDEAVWTNGNVIIDLPRAGTELVVTYAAIARNWCVPELWRKEGQGAPPPETPAKGYSP